MSNPCVQPPPLFSRPIQTQDQNYRHAFGVAERYTCDCSPRRPGTAVMRGTGYIDGFLVAAQNWVFSARHLADHQSDRSDHARPQPDGF